MKLNRLLIAASLLLCSFGASAQTLLWHQTEIAWTPSTTCADGSPASNCPIIGWTVETAVAATGSPWTQLSTELPATLRRTYSNLAAGPHCYRMIGRSALGNSVPGNVFCRTNTPPLPNPPALVVIESQAMSVKMDWEGAFGLVPSTLVGSVPIGTPCNSEHDIDVDGWYKVPLESVAWIISPSNRPKHVVARCALN